MNYTKQIVAAMMEAAQLAKREKEVEDSSHIYRKSLYAKAKAQVEKAAREHAEKAVFDGRKFDTHNPQIALDWGHFLNSSEAVELREDYEIAFSEYAPQVHECNKCENSYTGRSCPTCENRRFEYNHRAQ